MCYRNFCISFAIKLLMSISPMKREQRDEQMAHCLCFEVVSICLLLFFSLTALTACACV